MGKFEQIINARQRLCEATAIQNNPVTDDINNRKSLESWEQFLTTGKTNDPAVQKVYNILGASAPKIAKDAVEQAQLNLAQQAQQSAAQTNQPPVSNASPDAATAPAPEANQTPPAAPAAPTAPTAQAGAAEPQTGATAGTAPNDRRPQQTTATPQRRV